MNFVESRLSSLGSGGGDVVVSGDFDMDLLGLNENLSSKVFYYVIQLYVKERAIYFYFFLCIGKEE